MPACAALAAVLACAGCDAEPPPAEERLLVVDGIAITLAEVEPYVAFLDSIVPEAGRKTKLYRVLDEHVLPLRLAQRAFPEERQLQLQRARGLSEVATNVHELDQQSAQISDRMHRDLTRMQAKLPVAMFLFDTAQLGAASPPIELANGYVVAGAFDLHESPRKVEDYVEALLVGFATHENDAWNEWLLAERQRVADRVTFVHPDYREAIPSWLRLPSATTPKGP